MLGEQFDDWGWRIPFLLSIVLLAISVYIRLQLQESPVFQEMKDEGKLSKAPLTEAFGNWKNLKIVLLALFGATAGQAVVWYGGQFYALFFLEKILQVEALTANLIIAAALLIGTPFFVIFGALSDAIGRKTHRHGGLRARGAHVFPGVPRADALRESGAGAGRGDRPGRRWSPIPRIARFQFDPVGKTAFTKSCDVVKSALAKAGVPYENEAGGDRGGRTLRIGDGSERNVYRFVRRQRLRQSAVQGAPRRVSARR